MKNKTMVSEKACKIAKLVMLCAYQDTWHAICVYAMLSLGTCTVDYIIAMHTFNYIAVVAFLIRTVCIGDGMDIIL